MEAQTAQPSRWDALPRELQDEVLAAAGPLTQHLCNRAHPRPGPPPHTNNTNTSSDRDGDGDGDGDGQLASQRAALRVWCDALRLEWPGDASLLPPFPCGGATAGTPQRRALPTHELVGAVCDAVRTRRARGMLAAALGLHGASAGASSTLSASSTSGFRGRMLLEHTALRRMWLAGAVPAAARRIADLARACASGGHTPLLALILHGAAPRTASASSTRTTRAAANTAAAADPPSVPPEFAAAASAWRSASPRADLNDLYALAAASGRVQTLAEMYASAGPPRRMGVVLYRAACAGMDASVAWLLARPPLSPRGGPTVRGSDAYGGAAGGVHEHSDGGSDGGSDSGSDSDNDSGSDAQSSANDAAECIAAALVGAATFGHASTAARLLSALARTGPPRREPPTDALDRAAAGRHWPAVDVLLQSSAPCSSAAVAAAVEAGDATRARHLASAATLTAAKCAPDASDGPCPRWRRPADAPAVPPHLEDAAEPGGVPAPVRVLAAAARQHRMSLVAAVADGRPAADAQRCVELLRAEGNETAARVVLDYLTAHRPRE
ncbi:hypothetical protein HK105_207292 [Polyrhizophydium stewartii]|uniref:Ankyrin repeat protein n=1 Tax=Polyrhizophydium stewartii TaxID=2732419 RepID=A0ABR4N127_9FUNG|nr:hypothetical protein HK105_002297 [Polyrhizophydium stewartii]